MCDHGGELKLQWALLSGYASWPEVLGDLIDSHPMYSHFTLLQNFMTWLLWASGLAWSCDLMKAEIAVDVTSPVKMIGAVSNVARVILEAVVARTEWSTESNRASQRGVQTTRKQRASTTPFAFCFVLVWQKSWTLASLFSPKVSIEHNPDLIWTEYAQIKPDIIDTLSLQLDEKLQQQDASGLRFLRLPHPRTGTD